MVISTPLGRIPRRFLCITVIHCMLDVIVQVICASAQIVSNYAQITLQLPVGVGLATLPLEIAALVTILSRYILLFHI